MMSSFNHATETALGVALVTASAVAFSTAGLFTRIISLDVWTMLFWRGVFGSLAILAFLCWRDGRGVRKAFDLDRAALAVAVGSALSTICFITALRLTSVADVTVIFATTPFIAAALSWLWTGRREAATTLWASGAALLGVAVTVGGGAGDTHLIGAALALLAAVFTAMVMIVLQQNRHVSFLPAACAAGLILAVVVAPLSSPRLDHGVQFVWLAGFGIVQFALGLTLLVVGTQKISATRSALIGSLETPLAPLMVWAAFGEMPLVAAWIGGTIVMAAVIGDLILTRSRAA